MNLTIQKHFMGQHPSDIKQKGVLTLMSVLIMGAVGLTVGVSLILLGLADSRTNFALEQSNQAKALANACTEEALQQIRDSAPFTGTSSLILGYGTCSYAVTNTGGTSRKITASGTVGTVIRKNQITISAINPSILISSWQEVADFN